MEAKQRQRWLWGGGAAAVSVPGSSPLSYNIRHLDEFSDDSRPQPLSCPR